MERASYGASIKEFLKTSDSEILGNLAKSHTNQDLVITQTKAWIEQIGILKRELYDLEGFIYFEFSIPRMGKRVDNIIISGDCVFVVEFKVGANEYLAEDRTQTIDYALDLRNFHSSSHATKLVPVLVCTGAKSRSVEFQNVTDLKTVLLCNEGNLRDSLMKVIDPSKNVVNPEVWYQGDYHPTPTIIEGAQALYANHSILDLSRSESGVFNLTQTTNRLHSIIDNSRASNKKSICFLTGVPGAGKTLAGLNIATQIQANGRDNAVFLSGNGPLVQVLREALTRDAVFRAKTEGITTSKTKEQQKVHSFVQNIHHFRDDYLHNPSIPYEQVVVFDEAQRAWSEQQLNRFLSKRHGVNYNLSEPELLIDILDRHKDWATIICLIGGGQEINTGEAGLEEWLAAIRLRFKDWEVYYSDAIISDKDYIPLIYASDEHELTQKGECTKFGVRTWLVNNCFVEPSLHLPVSVRSFRSEKVSKFVNAMLDLDIVEASSLYNEIRELFPIYVTRDIQLAKNWLTEKKRGSEKIGLLASSEGKRLRPIGIDVKHDIYPPDWFLNPDSDIRSSQYLEDVATEFHIQGLEIDYACVVWDADFAYQKDDWFYRSFRGSKWQNINAAQKREYMKNSYRVLLTRSRQGMIICVPDGSDADQTRPHCYYDGTYNYLKNIGIQELC